MASCRLNAAIALPSLVESVQITLMANVEFIVAKIVAHPKRHFDAIFDGIFDAILIPPWHVEFKFN